MTMSEMVRTWFIVDDQPKDAESFLAGFKRSTTGPYLWDVLPPGKALSALAGKERGSVAGILLDIDLSSDPTAQGNGLGIAQSLRGEQKKGEIDDYPLFRFANTGPIEKYIGGDPGSDDL